MKLTPTQKQYFSRAMEGASGKELLTSLLIWRYFKKHKFKKLITCLELGMMWHISYTIASTIKRI